MFKQAKLHCNHLTVLLNISPANKITPVQTVDERIEILSAIKYIDNIICYSTEQELYNLLKTNNFDIRFLGSDYKDKDFTGKDLELPIHFIERDHSYSATTLKQKIFDSINLQFKHIINGDV